MGSAKSQKKFLDKQSETFQKNSSSKKSTDMRRNVEFSKSPLFHLKSRDLIHLCVIFMGFSDFCVFLNNHNGLCEIAEYFFLINNLRLVRKVPAPRNLQI